MGREQTLTHAGDQLSTAPAEQLSQVDRARTDAERRRRLAFARILLDSQHDAGHYVENYTAGRGAE